MRALVLALSTAATYMAAAGAGNAGTVAEQTALVVATATASAIGTDQATTANATTRDANHTGQTATGETGSRPTATSTPPAEPSDYWTGAINSPVPLTLSGGVVISDVHRLQTLQKDKNAVVIDVSNAPQRPDNMAPGAPWLPLPHQAIPGSLWIPGVGLGEVPPALGDFFRAQLAAATGNDPARPIVIYCHQSCWLSWNAAKRAISYGYLHVYWYRDGIEGWKAAHLPTAVIEPRVAPES
jgi:PQQ-dependent catabolism-associated CXXCW motif protein